MKNKIKKAASISGRTTSANYNYWCNASQQLLFIEAVSDHRDANLLPLPGSLNLRAIPKYRVVIQTCHMCAGHGMLQCKRNVKLLIRFEDSDTGTADGGQPKKVQLQINSSPREYPDRKQRKQEFRIKV
ncbi:hypothetical protein V9T40_006050 [Parthenolecanium corni]|uniref:Uncharacterized protein n=1 Tax=Parthenolecanium corni TaxID=536013 RepID=A0AAN9YB06_9HEMI